MTSYAQYKARRKILKAQIKETRATLRALRAELRACRREMQHAQIDHLETYIDKARPDFHAVRALGRAATADFRKFWRRFVFRLKNRQE